MDVSVINVTPKRAERLLSLRWERQRKIRPGHVLFLASEMKIGRFEPSTIELVTISETNSQVLIDGQHALKAIVLCGKSQVMILKERIVQKEEQVSYIFSRIDVHTKRKLGDSLFAFSLSRELKLNRWYLKKLSSAITFIDLRFGVKTTKETAIEDTIKKIAEWSDAGRKYIDVYESGSITSEKTRFLNRAPLSIGLITFKYVKDKDKVKNFWNGFIHGANLTERDPRLLARNKYMSISTYGGGSGQLPYKEKWHANTIARLVAWSWNMHYLGENRTKIAIRNKDKKYANIEIKGTKYYTGRQV